MKVYFKAHGESLIDTHVKLGRIGAALKKGRLGELAPSEHGRRVVNCESALKAERARKVLKRYGFVPLAGDAPTPPKKKAKRTRKKKTD